MRDEFEVEEKALRRRLLFRMLRGFSFDRPQFRGEWISEPLPRSVVAQDYHKSLSQQGFY